VRLRSSASGSLNRTFVAGDTKTWTWSAWVKRGSLSGTQQFIFNNTASQSYIQFNTSENITAGFYSTNSATSYVLTTSQVFRDPSAWYHVVWAVDTTQATNTNRIKLYVNGVQVTAFSSATYPAQNDVGQINTAAIHRIASYDGSIFLFDGYLTEINFVNAQQLTPSSFGSTNAITGVWQPAKYTGTYGTNGFYLNFSDNSNNTATTIGKDYSGNGNNWTPNNISVTAGSTYDSMTDVPTLTSATAANYAVLNPLRSYSANTISNANLNVLFTDATSSRTTFSTFGITSGKWYFEMTVIATGGGYYPGVGVNTDLSFAPSGQSGDTASGYMYLSTGQKLSAGLASYGSSYTTNDVIGIALDMDGGTITFYKNNTSQGQAYSGITGTAVPCFIGNASSSCAVNFGQRPFSYTPPTGYVALNTYNLPDSTIKNGAGYMAATTYTGNGTNRSISNAVNGVSFQPDFVWVKNRTNAYDHDTYDSLRPQGSRLITNLTNAEGGTTTVQVNSFNSDGFGLGTYIGVNESGSAFVGWQWKAGTTSSSNTNGSITSTVSVGATQGFSVVTYTGTGTNQTVGHGLGVAPAFIIAKSRNNAVNWITYHQSLGKDSYMNLNTTNASASLSNYWGTSVNSSTFGFLSTAYDNANGNMVAYCFAAVKGYSAFGSYTGNNSADGPFVYTGFRPRWILFKDSTNAATNWVLQDTSRFTYNLVAGGLLANTTASEYSSGYDVDILSNGFKIRRSGGDTNQSSANIVYACFAENPFRNALAR
jgi:hypothetical protein